MTTEHVRVGSGELLVRRDGPARGPVVVFVHSLGTTHRIWDPQVDGLAGRVHTLCYDQRGHGGSSAPTGPCSVADLGADLLEVLDRLDIERASICGISLGGVVAQWVAANAPERVDRLVLACTAAEFGPAGPWLDRAAAARSSGTAALVDTVVPRWFTEGFARRQPDTVAAVSAMLAGCSDAGYAACCESLATVDQSADLTRIVAPTLVIAGADDHVTPPSTALAITSLLPRASLVVLAAASHLANLEQPARFTSALLEHLIAPLVDRGAATRREVLGERHVAHAEMATNSFTRPFEDLVTRYAWGEIWSRPGLDRRSRSAVTVGLLAALGRSDELKFHIEAALGNGLTRDEIAEVLLHCALYCGMPTGRAAFAVASATFAAIDAGEPVTTTGGSSVSGSGAPETRPAVPS